MASTIFVIDSSPAVRRMVEQISAPEGYEVIGFQDGPTALEAARRMAPAMIVADYHLENMTFSGFCKEVNKLDTLTETIIISLVAASDRLDEGHLRSLGVRGFLKKPFQSEHLLDAIKNLRHGSKREGLHHKGSKKRIWPPVSTSTDMDDDENRTTTDLTCDALNEADPTEENPPMTPSPSIGSTIALPTKPSASRTAGGEEALKGLFDHLLQSVSQQAENRIVALLPAVIAKELSAQITTVVVNEVSKQVAASLSVARLKALVQDIIVEELPKQTGSHISTLDATVRQTVSELAPPLIERTSEVMIRDQVSSGLTKLVPDAVRDHLGPIDLMVKREVQQVVSQCARQIAEDLVREMAPEPIQQAVRKLVPDIAEAQVKDEIKRLTTAE